MNIKIHHPKGYWTKERIIGEAKKYTTLSEFAKNNSGAYDKAKKMDWVKYIKPYFKVVGNTHSKCIYCYEFTDNHVYVGLTYNIDIRESQHMFRGPVKEHMDKTGLSPTRKQLTEYIPVKQAIEREGYYQRKYFTEGWFSLHRAKPGAVGGTFRVWDYESCLLKAREFKSRDEFRIKYPGAYKAIHKNNWCDESFAHMKQGRRLNGYCQDKENCLNSALECRSRNEFATKFPGEYAVSCDMGWLDEICSHMVAILKPKRYWNKITVLEESKKYNIRGKFHKEAQGAYDCAKENGWLDEACGHMIKLREKKGHWTKENCSKEASKYKSKGEFQKLSVSAYTVSWKNKWLKEFFQ